MKALGGILLALGLLGLIWPAIAVVFLEGKGAVSLAPLLGVMAISMGAGLLIAAVLTKKK